MYFRFDTHNDTGNGLVFQVFSINIKIRSLLARVWTFGADKDRLCSVNRQRTRNRKSAYTAELLRMRVI